MKQSEPPFRYFADFWKNEARALIEELNLHGFAAEANNLFVENAKDLFQRPLRARAFNDDARLGAFNGQNSFCYVSKDTKAKALNENAEIGWGLLFADLSFKSQNLKVFEKSPTVFVKNPDAAVDFILRKISALPWAALESHQNEKFEAVLLEPGALIGPNVSIGKGSVVETGVRIGARVVIGENSRIGAYTKIADDCVLGNGVQIASHVSIGGQGFGFVKYPKVPAPFPRLHVGRAVIGDQVRIGSFVSIDRGVFEDTSIGSYSAFDNHVQIAHNCVVGNHNVYCGFVGLSGSTQVGDRVTFGAMAGTKGHLKVGADSIVAGQSGVTADLPSKSIVKGYPPRPLQESLKIQVLVGKLPELYDRIKKLEKEKR